MKKVIKPYNKYLKQEITFTVDERLNKLKGKIPPSKKLAEVNELLSKAKRPFPWEK